VGDEDDSSLILQREITNRRDREADSSWPRLWSRVRMTKEGENPISGKTGQKWGTRLRTDEKANSHPVGLFQENPATRVGQPSIASFRTTLIHFHVSSTSQYFF
jgi:hypothetical protein